MSNDTPINQPGTILIREATVSTIARCVFYSYEWDTQAIVMIVQYWDDTPQLVKRERWTVDAPRYKGAPIAGDTWQDTEDQGVSVIMNNVINNGDTSGVEITEL